MTPYWQSEKHGLAIYHGDCLALLPELAAAGEKFALCVTDPPYNRGVGYANRSDDSLPPEHYELWCKVWFRAAQAVSEAVVFTCGMQNVGLWERIERPTWWLAWDTTNRLMKRTPIGYSRWEPVAVYGQATQMRPDIFRAPIISDEFAGEHPCPKPVSWAVWLTETFSAVGDSVLDPFAGTGPVLAACARLGRKCIAVEISEEYCDLAARRLEQEIAQGRLFEPAEIATPRQEGLGL